MQKQSSHGAYFYSFKVTANEPHHDKTNKMACAHSEDSDQPGHPQSHQSLRCPLEETFGPSLPRKRTAKTLIRLGGCTG